MPRKLLRRLSLSPLELLDKSTRSEWMQIVLFRPQIPQNTGNIVRTCNVTGASLILVRPLGFDTSDKMLKRAGLDYWNDVKIEEIDNLEAYLEKTNSNFYFYSSHATKSYFEITHMPDDVLIFGSETSGLPDVFQQKWPDRFVTLPMLNKKRCLNLSNACAIALYEALRQTTFAKKD